MESGLEPDSLDQRSGRHHHVPMGLFLLTNNANIPTNMEVRYRPLFLFALLLVLLLCCNSSSASSDSTAPSQQQETCVVGLDGTTTSGSCDQQQQVDDSTTNANNNNNDNYKNGEDIGVRQDFDINSEVAIQKVLNRARKYLKTIIFAQPRYTALRNVCRNRHVSCAFWATAGECQKNSPFMNVSCGPVCESCEYVDLDALIPATHSERSLEVGEDMGVRQETGNKSTLHELLKQTRQYMETVIFADPKYTELVDQCKNQHESCTYWASVGECESNPVYMNLTCAPVCKACEYLLMETRCPMDPNATDALYPGDLDRLFESITTHSSYLPYEPKVWSRPDLLPGDSKDTASYQLGPWVVTLENFVSADEAKRLIEIGTAQGYQVSGNMGNLKFDGTYESHFDDRRTSTNTWCEASCMADPITAAIQNRIVNLTGIPEPNMEFLQLLRYYQGQYYVTHHDYMEHHVRRQPGVRMLTVFLYLNDVEAGGGTNFPTLDLTVMPKLGRVLIWPSVLNADPNLADMRTEHQALPVERGVKYGANAWIHQREFKTPNRNGCSG